MKAITKTTFIGLCLLGSAINVNAQLKYLRYVMKAVNCKKVYLFAEI